MSGNVIVQLVGGVALLAAGVVLIVLGQHESGTVIASAGAAELSVKGVVTAVSASSPTPPTPAPTITGATTPAPPASPP